MPQHPDHAAPVTADELRVLLRLAGLEVSAERAPAVLAELNSQLALARTLDGVLTGTEPPVLAPYDPAFPGITGENKPE